MLSVSISRIMKDHYSSSEHKDTRRLSRQRDCISIPASELMSALSELESRGGADRVRTLSSNLITMTSNGTSFGMVEFLLLYSPDHI